MTAFNKYNAGKPPASREVSPIDQELPTYSRLEAKMKSLVVLIFYALVVKGAEQRLALNRKPEHDKITPKKVNVCIVEEKKELVKLEQSPTGKINCYVKKAR